MFDSIYIYIYIYNEMLRDKYEIKNIFCVNSEKHLCYKNNFKRGCFI